MSLAPAELRGLFASGQAPGAARTWRYALALVGCAVAWLLAWYWETASSIVQIWERSETFAHGYVIPPLCAWLIWRQRHAVATLQPRPGYAALPLLALTGFAWLFAHLAGVGVVQQYCLATMVGLLVWAILGGRVAWALSFPLAYLLFAVPFGEFLVPPLMEHTADFTVLALRATGIPVYREGLYFTIPSGHWSVVEACSGLRYLIASLTLGVLYAYLTYRSLQRRVLFIALSLVVPIVANWVRAYMIVMIGHLSGMKYAVGVDHLIYGWVFFGAVMLLLFWIGGRWREDLDPPAASQGVVAVSAPAGPAPLAAMVAATLAACALLSAWPLLATRLMGDGGQERRPPVLGVPEGAAWQPVAERLNSWTPLMRNPRAQLAQTYAKDGNRAGLYIAYYRDQRKGAELITSLNALVPQANSDWLNVGEKRRTLSSAGGSIPAVEARLRGPNGSLLVWYWYWVDGQYVVDPYVAKLLQAKAKLLGHGDDAAIVILQAPYEDPPGTTDRVLQQLLDSLSPAISRSLENARRAQPAS